MRLCLKLGGKLQDYLTVPLYKYDSAEYLSHLTEVLLQRNDTLIRLFNDEPEFYLEKPMTSIHTFMKSIKKDALPSNN